MNPRAALVAFLGACLVWVGAFLFGYHAGRASTYSEWEAAVAKQRTLEASTLEAKKDDQENVAAVARAEEWQRLSELLKQDRDQVDALRKTDSFCHPITGAELQ
jgi:hypothetical protein